MITESEAKEKWCPFARVGVHAGSGGAAVNRYPVPEVQKDANCIGSACMAWRWRTPVPPGITPEEKQGGCGLAGPAVA